MENTQAGTVYFIRVGKNFWKIGRTKRYPKDRIKDLESSCPYEIQFFHAIKIFDSKKDQSFLLEKFFHKKFSHRHHRNEWFKMNVSEVKSVLNEFWYRIENDKKEMIEHIKSYAGDFTIQEFAREKK